MKFSESQKKILKYYSNTDANQIFLKDQSTISERYSPEYGVMMAKQLIKQINEEKIYNILEVGGGRGQLAFDMLTYIRNNFPKTYKRINYTILELSNNLITVHKKKLKEFNIKSINASAIKLPFKDNSQELIVISNEMIADIPYEKIINPEKIDKRVLSIIKKTDINLKKLENKYLNTGAIIFLIELKRILKKGVVNIIEYGYKSKTKLCYFGTKKSDHHELAVDWNLIKKCSEQIYQDIKINNLSDFFQIKKTKTTKSKKSLLNIRYSFLESNISKLLDKLYKKNKSKKEIINLVTCFEKEVHNKNDFKILLCRRVSTLTYMLSRIIGLKKSIKIGKKIVQIQLNKENQKFQKILNGKLSNKTTTFACMTIYKQ